MQHEHPLSAQSSAPNLPPQCTQQIHTTCIQHVRHLDSSGQVPDQMFTYVNLKPRTIHPFWSDQRPYIIETMHSYTLPM